LLFYKNFLFFRTGVYPPGSDLLERCQAAIDHLYKQL
jgi:hypothetical protein